MYGSGLSRWKREVYVFPTSNVTDEAAAPFIHICLNFCKTGPDTKKRIIPFFSLFGSKFATRHMVLSRRALLGSLHIF